MYNNICRNSSAILSKSYTLRCRSDVARIIDYESTVDLAYASYQSTDMILGKTDPKLTPHPILLIHGIFGCKSNFNTLCKRFHESSTPKRLVYAVDLRNHGDSPHTRTFSYDQMVMDVLFFIKRMNLKKTSLLGHDIGGRVAMLLALKHPDVVEKLIISEMSPITTSPHFKKLSQVLRVIDKISFIPRLSLHQAQAHVANNASRFIKSRDLMTLVLTNLVKKDGRIYFRFNSKALMDNFEDIASFPDVHNSTFNGPVLFIGGSKSDYIQKSDFGKIKKLFPKVESKFIEGAGHWVHLEKPAQFSKVTVGFLNEKVIKALI